MFSKLVPVPSGSMVPDRDLGKTPILECINLGITFGGLKAVENFNLTIGRTEIAGLIGPNGAGKTTVFNLLTKVYQPTKGTILRMARECGKHVELVDCLVDGAFGLDQDQFKARMTEMVATIADQVDVIVFAQGSMAYCEEYIAEKFGKVVLSSPRFGAAELKKALEKKGTI